MEDTEVLTLDSMPQEQTSNEAMQTPLPAQNSSPDDAQLIGERSRTVPYGALAEERARRKELQRELRESTATRQQLQERLEALHALARQEPQAAEAPSHIEAAAAPTVDDGAADTMAATQADSAFRTQVLRSVRSYATERPDFMQAYEHARKARVEELAALGYAPDEAMAITFNNEMDLINSAFAAGRNPAQVIYDFALRRGYSPMAEAGQPRPTNRAAPMSEAEKVALAARGQAAAKSLSAAGGGSTGTLTLEALAGMSDDEFAEATKGDRWQRLLRG